MKQVINLDWLQVFCHGKELTQEPHFTTDYKITAQDSGKETLVFQKLYYIYFGKIKVAEVQQVPRSRIINPEATIVKLENRILYTTQYMHVLQTIFQVYKLHYKGVTRIDICLDSTEILFKAGVQKFLKSTIQKEECEKGFIFNSAFNNATYHVHRNGKGQSRINSCKWGSSKSGVTCKCYDKTLELIEVKDKPWIRHMWEINGIDYQYNDDELYKLSEKQKRKMVSNIGLAQFVKNPVYRWEISIKAEGKEVVRTESGEILQLSLNDVENNVLLRNIFFSFAAHYFDFRQNQGQKNRRFFKPVEIFKPTGDITMLPISINTMLETGRSEKTCYNKLDKVLCQVDENDRETQYHFEKVMEFLAGMASIKKSLYMVKRERDERKRLRPWSLMSKEYLLQMYEIMRELRSDDKYLPSQAEIDLYMSAAIEDVPFTFDVDNSLYPPITDEMQLMQSSMIVIPERAERVSPCQME